MRNFVVIVSMLAFQLVQSQTIDKKFLGCWGDSFWEFHFSKDGKFERISSGHYGFTTVKGQYTVKNDTIKILSGFKDTDGTVNEFYVIDDNDVLIDLNLGYGHPSFEDNQQPKSCHTLLYPEIRPVRVSDVTDMEEVLNIAFNTNSIKGFFHFDKLPARKLIVANYYELKAAIAVDRNKAIFKNKADIKDEFFIEFVELSRFYDLISFKLNIHGEGASISGYYKKVDGKWVEDSIIVVEN